jgi:hypothetical protein
MIFNFIAMKIEHCFRSIQALALLLLLIYAFSACSYKTGNQILKQSNAAKYRTSFPAENVSSELENIFQSVKQIKNYSSYRTYVFDENTSVTLNDLNSDGLLERTRAGIVTNDATSGTALIIFSDGNRIALLTCAHAVKAPDTIIEWAEYSDLGNNRFIHSISFKTKQQLFVNDMPLGSKFELLAFDSKNDFAFIGATFTEPVMDVPVFEYPCGNSMELKWGSFLYLAGYPKGQQMLTHGIVSKPQAKTGSFLTDAPFNEGLSGGIALAVTESDNKFELLGIARSVAASYGYVLKPEKENHEFTYNPAIPYTGSIYVNQKKDINYGITSVVSIDQIKQFYMSNRKNLLLKGFNFDDFFGLKPESD